MGVGGVVNGDRDVVTAAEWAGGAALLAEALRRSQAGLMEQVGAGEQDDRRASQRNQTDRTVAGVPLGCLSTKDRQKH